MRVAAVLGVKDEVELIAAAIAHLRAIGVDQIVACDDSSTDGTAAILEQERDGENFQILNSSHWPGDPASWSAPYLEIVRALRADWVIFLDADEFWIPAGGDLKRCIALADADALQVARFNVPLTAAGPAWMPAAGPAAHDRLLLYVEAAPDFAAFMRENPDFPWIRGVDGPKVMARTAKVGSLLVGAHDVTGPAGGRIRKQRPTDLLIAHLPFTTPQRFARKVENIRRAVTAYPAMFSGQLAWHWRRWLTLAEEGRLDEEFGRQVLDGTGLVSLREAGVIRSAAEVFAEWSAVASGQPLSRKPAGQVTQPLPFAWESRENVAPGKIFTTLPRLVRGITRGVQVEIEGDPSAAYAVNGGMFSRIPGTVEVGDSLVLRMTAPPQAGAKASCTLRVGDYQTAWQLATRMRCGLVQFAYADRVGVRPGTTITTQDRVMAGIEVPVPIVIAGEPSARYAVNGGAFTVAPGTIAEGDRLRVCMTSAVHPGATVTAEITVGELKVRWSLTTAA